MVSDLVDGNGSDEDNGASISLEVSDAVASTVVVASFAGIITPE